MRTAPRVVINCAGEGRRLGLGSTKALVSVLGRPLISWHLAMLRDVHDVVVVTGHQAPDLVEHVVAERPDAVFAINHDYAVTGTAASLALGARGAAGDVISLDGDLLVHPEDFRAFLDASEPCIGVAPPNTTDAVFAEVEQTPQGPVATGFNRDGVGVEWTGLLRCPASLIGERAADNKASGHVYEMLSGRLPMAAHDVRAREIDTPADYDRAVSWLRPIANHWTTEIAA